MTIAHNLIRSVVSRIEALDEEIKGLNDDKKDVFAEVKSQGLDVAALKTVIAKRRKDPDKLNEHESLVALYEAALGTDDATRARARDAA
jgi:uncharacterized protein (UPF0335 family)